MEDLWLNILSIRLIQIGVDSIGSVGTFICNYFLQTRKVAIWTRTIGS